jgi:hypothetical protein
MKVRFPNESEYVDTAHFKMSAFTLDKEFSDVVFGWYGDIYIEINKEDYEAALDTTSN